MRCEVSCDDIGVNMVMWGPSKLASNTHAAPGKHDTGKLVKVPSVSMRQGNWEVVQRLWQPLFFGWAGRQVDNVTPVSASVRPMRKH